MDKNALVACVRKGHSTYRIAQDLGLSQTTVRYWMKKFKIQTAFGRHGKRHARGDYTCSCGETDPHKFYGTKKFVCGACHNKDCLKRGNEKKKKIVELLGGSCCLCGYNRTNSALDVHHTDPRKKDPDWGGVRSWRWSRIEKELVTCVLLCRNCHAEVHCGIAVLPNV